MARDFFNCYHSYLEKVKKLSDQEVGRLFRSLMEYSETGKMQELTGRESIAFDFIANDIDRDKEAYESKCKQNSMNRRSTTVNDGQRTLTKRDENARPFADNSKEKEAKRNIYISTTSRELKDSDSVDIREDSLSRDSSRDSTAPLLEKDKAKEPTRSRKPSNTTVLDGFDTFWLIYPNKKAKKDARKAWEKIKPNEELQQTIIAAVNEQKQSKQWIEGYVPYPATWLNGERWNDVEDKPQSVNPQRRALDNLKARYERALLEEQEEEARNEKNRNV